MTLQHRWKRTWYAVIMSVVLVISFPAGAAFANGQVPKVAWESKYEPGIKIFEVFETDEGYTMIGTKNKKGAYLVRSDADGNIQWEKVLNLRTSNNKEVIITAAYYTQDGGYLLGGTVPGYQSYYYVVRTDSHGDILWEKEEYVWNYVEFNDIRETSDGGAIFSFNKDESFGYIVKLNAAGDLQWTNSMDMSKFDPYVSIESVSETPDGGYIAGTFRAATYLLWKLDASGESKWLNYHGDGIGWVVPTTDHGYAIANHNLRTNQSNLIMTDWNGQERWSKDLGVNGTARSISRTMDNGYLIGISNSLIQCDEQGHILWRKPVSQLTKALPTKDGGAIFITSYESVVKLEGQPAY